MTYDLWIAQSEFWDTAERKSPWTSSVQHWASKHISKYSGIFLLLFGYVYSCYKIMENVSLLLCHYAFLHHLFEIFLLNPSITKRYMDKQKNEWVREIPCVNQSQIKGMNESRTSLEIGFVYVFSQKFMDKMKQLFILIVKQNADFLWGTAGSSKTGKHWIRSAWHVSCCLRTEFCV